MVYLILGHPVILSIFELKIFFSNRWEFRKKKIVSILGGDYRIHGQSLALDKERAMFVEVSYQTPSWGERLIA